MNIVTVRLESRILFMPTDVTVLLPEHLPARSALEWQMRPAVERSEGVLPPEHLPARSENCSGGGNPNSGGEKLKVVCLLHGAGGDHRSFLETADLDGMMRKHPAIYVLPSALNSDFGNYEQFGTGYDFPSYFFEELIPFIYATFPASPAREENYLASVSMGGFGTFSLGLQRPDRFAVLGVMGASLRESEYLKEYADMDSVAFRKMVLANRKAYPTEYGRPDEGIKLKELNVITKYPTVRDFLNSPDAMWERFPEVAARGDLPQIYVACGTKDLFYPGTARLQKMAEDLGVTEQMHFKIAEGVGHSGAFFDAEIGNFLEYYEV